MRAHLEWYKSNETSVSIDRDQGNADTYDGTHEISEKRKSNPLGSNCDWEDFRAPYKLRGVNAEAIGDNI